MLRLNHLLLFVFVVFLPWNTIGQESSFRPTERPPTPEIHLDSLPELDSTTSQLLIIPFEPRMYRSDVDRALAESNGMSSKDIRQNFRQGISNALVIEATKAHRPLAMLSPNPELQEDLRYTYQCIGYQYTAVPPKPEAAPVTLKEKVKQRFKRKEKPAVVSKTGLESGQIQTTRGTAERYMRTEVVNERMLAFLGSKHQAEYFLFINEMDLLFSSQNTQQQYESDSFLREIKVHYTVLDRKGKEVTGGLASETFSSQTNDLRKIIKQHFPNLARQVLENLSLTLNPETLPAK